MKTIYSNIYRDYPHIENIIEPCDCAICEKTFDIDELYLESYSDKYLCIGCIRNLSIENIDDVFDTGGDKKLAEEILTQIKAEIS